MDFWRNTPFSARFRSQRHEARGRDGGRVRGADPDRGAGMRAPVRIGRQSRARWRSSPAVKRVLGAGRPRRKLKTEEHDAQVALFRDYIVPRLVPNAVAFAIPNGGKRHKKVAIALKAEGGAAGVPDIFVLHRRQVYFLEMKKAKGGKVSKEQRDMIARLVGAG